MKYWLLLLIGFALGIWALQDPGRAHLEYGPWSLHIPLWPGLLGVLTAGGLLVYVAQCLVWVVRAPIRLQRYFKNRRLVEHQKQFEKGWSFVLQGDYAAAEKAFASSRQYAGWVAALCAAQAAHLGHLKNPSRHFQDIPFRMGVDETIACLKMDWAFSEGQYGQALDIMERLPDALQRKPKFSLMKVQALSALDRLEEAGEALANLKSYGSFFKRIFFFNQEPSGNPHHAQLPVYEKNFYLRCLELVEDGVQLENAWKRLPSLLKMDETVVLGFSRKLETLRGVREAYLFLRGRLNDEFKKNKTVWPSVVEFWVSLKGFEKPMLAWLEEKLDLESAPTWGGENEWPLWLSYARVAVRAGLWQQAQLCYEKIGQQCPSKALWSEIGDFWKSQGLLEKALAAYEKSVH